LCLCACVHVSVSVCVCVREAQRRIVEYGALHGSVRVCVYACVWVSVCYCTDMHAYIVHICARARTHTHTHIQKVSYTHIHTRTGASLQIFAENTDSTSEICGFDLFEKFQGPGGGSRHDVVVGKFANVRTYIYIFINMCTFVFVGLCAYMRGARDMMIWRACDFDDASHEHLCMYMYVYIHIYIYIYIYTYIYIYKYMNISIQTYIHKCIFIHKYMPIET